MKVLAVYAHPDPASFTHAVLEELTSGLREAGHRVEVVDLYAMRFDPVFRRRDMATYLHEDMPPDILEGMNLRQRFIDNVPGGPVGRLIASRWAREKTPQQLAKFIREHAPKDAREQWQKVAAADGLAFVAPVFWLHFPAILKGWFERVFAYGSAYALSREGWEGHASGRIPLMRHDKALVITPTLFCEADYKADWEEPMGRIIDDWGLRYPGVKRVEHVYFYGAAIADPPQIEQYLRRARQLGRDFATPTPTAPTAGPPTAGA
ncbi:MAG TPA: NAD(P)H-dependent oxidoreductase [Solirubrobacteraceae bacterium]|nr:NAD(P)H-dependent oxidoreductase [Solirubrobacteraceae bacterium]